MIFGGNLSSFRIVKCKPHRCAKCHFRSYALFRVRFSVGSDDMSQSEFEVFAMISQKRKSEKDWGRGRSEINSECYVVTINEGPV